MYKRNDFRCPKCHHTEEKFYHVSEENFVCPRCKLPMVVLPPAPNLIGLSSSVTRNRHTLESQFPGPDGPNQLRMVVEGAMRHGYRPKDTDMYFSSLARFPGDPRAFGPSSDPDGYLQHMADQTGLELSGVKSYKPRRKKEESA